MSGELWTAEEVAGRLKVSVRHIRRMTSLKQIPYTKFGRLVRYNSLDVECWLRRCVAFYYGGVAR